MYIDLLIVLIITSILIYYTIRKRQHDWRDVVVSVVGFFILSGEDDPTWAYRLYRNLKTERAKNRYAWSAIVATAYFILTIIGLIWIAIKPFLQQIFQRQQPIKPFNVVIFIISISVFYIGSMLYVRRHLENIRD